MRSSLTVLFDLPSVREMRRCYSFQTAASVVLGDAAHFVEALDWCRSQWMEQRRRYRVQEGSRRTGPGTFEFADTTHAVEFKLRFG